MHTRGKKVCFGPANIADHLRYTLRDFIESKINTLDIDLVSSDMANKLLQEHLAGDYNTSAIGRLVTLKIWMEEFVEDVKHKS